MTDGDAVSSFWLRADVSPTIGLGHLLRCVALAERARARNIPVRFVVSDPALADAALERFDLTSSAAGSESWLDEVATGDSVMFDGYGIDRELLARARRRGARVGVLDDFDGGSFEADVLVNPSAPPGARYEVPVGARLLLGPRYALVRREFLTHRRVRSAGRSRVVVVFGGSDPTQQGPALAAALSSRHLFEEVVLVVGPGAASTPSAPGVHVVPNPRNLPALFDGANAVVSAAGTTTWEALAMGLPLGVVQVVDNQDQVVRTVTDAAAVELLGVVPEPVERLVARAEPLADPDVQQRLSRAGLELVDGSGADRVVDALIGPVDQSRG